MASLYWLPSNGQDFVQRTDLEDATGDSAVMLRDRGGHGSAGPTMDHDFVVGSCVRKA